MKMRAFNLIPGAAVSSDHEGEPFSVVAVVDRDIDHELVFGRYVGGEPFVHDFCDSVNVVGMSPNYADDNRDSSDDIGTDYGSKR